MSIRLRSSQLQNKSLMEANKDFLGRHEGTYQIDYMYPHGDITVSDKNNGNLCILIPQILWCTELHTQKCCMF